MPTDPRIILGPIPERPPRSPWKWVALGCTGLFVACIAFALGIGAFVLSGVRHSGAYELASARVRASPAVREALGQPIEEGWWVTGSVDVTGPSGKASLSFPVSGPRGKATVYVNAIKEAGEWELRLLRVRLASGEKLDLLVDDEGAPPGTAPAP